MTLRYSLSNPEFARKLILALQRAVVALPFNATDWIALGYKMDEKEYIEEESGLLFNLYEKNHDDYGACVFGVLEYFSKRNPDALQAIIDKVRSILERDAPDDVRSELGLNVTYVPEPKALSASQAVEDDLVDADTLLNTIGPSRCVDRLHTALHGYLKELCAKAGITVPESGKKGPSITAVFSQFRKNHPSFKSLGAQDERIKPILNGFASVIDAINTIRNTGSPAHPNDALVDETEAILVVNATRTLFHYISAKVRQ